MYWLPSCPRRFAVVIRPILISDLVSPTIVSSSRISHLREEGEGGLFIGDGPSDGDEFALLDFLFESHSLLDRCEGAAASIAASGGGGHHGGGGGGGGVEGNRTTVRGKEEEFAAVVM